jgi:hypothetical protein
MHIRVRAMMVGVSATIADRSTPRLSIGAGGVVGAGPTGEI